LGRALLAAAGDFEGIFVMIKRQCSCFAALLMTAGLLSACDKPAESSASTNSAAPPLGASIVASSQLSLTPVANRPRPLIDYWVFGTSTDDPTEPIPYGIIFSEDSNYEIMVRCRRSITDVILETVDKSSISGDNDLLVQTRLDNSQPFQNVWSAAEQSHAVLFPSDAFDFVRAMTRTNIMSVRFQRGGGVVEARFHVGSLARDMASVRYNGCNWTRFYANRGAVLDGSDNASLG
jgi:hypothetical protein